MDRGKTNWTRRIAIAWQKIDKLGNDGCRTEMNLHAGSGIEKNYPRFLLKRGANVVKCAPGEKPGGIQE